MIKAKLTIPDKEKLSRKIRDNLVDSGMIKDLNSEVVSEMKRFMEAGVSPVKGKRRFVPYKNKDKYPADRKPSRPVNLKLTGNLYAQLVAARVSATSFFIGISSLASEKIKTYAKANNLGENKIPERRFVPIKGEQFNVSLMRKIKDIISRRIAKIINK